MIGRLLGNRYEILEKLGSGGMAVVYKARCTLLNRIVTVKVMRDEYTSDADFVRRFRQEAQAVASLSHPNIVSVYDVGAEDHIYYIVMEYVGGQNLKELIRERAPFPPDEAADIARQIADALEHAHENNIVHRDIKPHNILITKNGRVKVTDFGIARAATAATVTRAGTIIGSVHYFSPEQAKGEVTGAKSDIYSLGVVLYEMLTGQVPFEGESPIGVALKHLQAEPTPVTAANPSVPAGLGRIVQRAMAKNPEFRYETAGDLSRDLRTNLAGKLRKGGVDDDSPTQLISGLDPGAATSAPSKGAGRERKKRVRPLGWVLLSLLVLGLLVGSVYALQPVLFPAETTVPDLYGKTEDAAFNELRHAGLKMEIRARQETDKLGKGLILSQEPEALSVVRAGRVVQVIISKGPSMAKVPPVVKKLLLEAQIDIRNAGFDPVTGPEDYIFDENVPKDKVVDQEPKAGIMQPEGTKIRLTVSKGSEPKQITMPDLVGMTIVDARTQITGLNLDLGSVAEEESTEFVPDQVLRQNPAANSPVMEGSEVSLVISKGPGPPVQTARVRVYVPDDGSDHVVRITVVDGRGTTQAYVATHGSGEVVRQDIRFYGKGKILFYIDDQLVKQQPVP